LFRTIILAISSIFISLSQYILPLPICHSIICSATLYLYILDYLINKNEIKINLKQTVGIIIGIIGILLTSNEKLINLWINP
jgi:uncharacterized membrane protein YjjP (DUF1212 family)